MEAPGKQLVLWTAALVALSGATLWKISSNASGRNMAAELDAYLPPEVSMILAFGVPPRGGENDKTVEKFHLTQVSVLSYLLNGSDAGKTPANLAGAGIDGGRPILVGGIGRLGLAPQRLLASPGFATVPQDWFVLVPVNEFITMLHDLGVSLRASVFRENETLNQQPVYDVAFPEARLAFAMPRDGADQWQGITGQPPPERKKIFCAELAGSGYAVVSTSRKCLAAGFLQSGDSRKTRWSALIGKLVSVFGSARGLFSVQITPAMFPEWKGLTGTAVFSNQEIRMSMEAELGDAATAFLSCKAVGFPLGEARANPDVDLYVETASEYLEHLAGSSVVDQIVQRAMHFDETEAEALPKFRDTLRRLIVLAKPLEPAQVFLTRGSPGSPGWAFAVSTDARATARVAAGIQQELTLACAKSDLAALVKTIPDATKTSLDDMFAGRLFHLPVPLLITNAHAEGTRFSRWNPYSADPQTGEIANPEKICLSTAEYDATIDGLPVQRLVPPTPVPGKKGDEDGGDEHAGRREPCFYHEIGSDRLFVGDGPGSIRAAVRYNQNFSTPLARTKALPETIARFKWEVASSAEHAIAVDDRAWLDVLLDHLAQINAQKASGRITLAGHTMRSSLVIALR